MQEGQWMCLVATPWWAYWCTYAGLTAEDLERVPERFALGLTEAAEINASQLASATARTVGAASGQSSVAKTKVAAATVGTSGSNERTVASGDSTVAYGASGYVDANGYGGQLESVRVKDREVPAVLARRPHEMDNSILQVTKMSVSDVPSRCRCRAFASVGVLEVCGQTCLYMYMYMRYLKNVLCTCQVCSGKFSTVVTESLQGSRRKKFAFTSAKPLR